MNHVRSRMCDKVVRMKQRAREPRVLGHKIPNGLLCHTVFFQCSPKFRQSRLTRFEEHHLDTAMHVHFAVS